MYDKFMFWGFFFSNFYVFFKIIISSDNILRQTEEKCCY